MRSTSIRPTALRPTSIRRLVGAGVGCVALSLSAMAMGSPAGAAEDTQAHHRPKLSAEQKQCMKDQGITRPIRPLTPEKITALKAAAKACDIKLPKHAGHHRPKLSAEQKQCMKDQGITRPIRPLTPEKITALKAAAAACGIQVPAGAPAQG